MRSAPPEAGTREQGLPQAQAQQGSRSLSLPARTPPNVQHAFWPQGTVLACTQGGAFYSGRGARFTDVGSGQSTAVGPVLLLSEPGPCVAWTGKGVLGQGLGGLGQGKG